MSDPMPPDVATATPVTTFDVALDPAERALLPTEEQVRFYREHGWFVTPVILPEALLDAAEAGIARFYAGQVDHPLPAGVSPGWQPEDGADVLRKNDHAWLQVDALAALIRYPLLGATAARLAGRPIRLWQDQLLSKPQDRPGIEANVGWHTDRSYWRCCTSENMLTAWIPFRDLSAADGTLNVIDASHLWPDERRELNFREQDLAGLEARFNSGGRAVVKRPLELRRGQVSFHHCRTMHGSGPNHDPRPRLSLAVHMQDEGNRWAEYEYRLPDGRVVKHDLERLCRLVDGVPDYTDPHFCPQLWPPRR